MNKSCLVAALAAVVVWMGAGGTGPLRNRLPIDRPRRAPPVAMVDVAYIFKKHPRFEAQMKEMLNDAEKIKGEYRKEAEALNTLAKNVEGFRLGTPEYKAAEEELFRKKSDLQTRMQLSEKEFRQRDAKIHYNIYQEIVQEVQLHCQANGIAIAINFNGDRINPEIPDSVMRGIMQNVVYSHKDLDITPYILRRLAPETARPAAGPMGVQPIQR